MTPNSPDPHTQEIIALLSFVLNNEMEEHVIELSCLKYKEHKQFWVSPKVTMNHT